MAGRAGKKRQTATPTGRTAPSPSSPGDRPEDADWLGERIRRLALGLTAALVVARAYWPAEGTTELETGQQLPWVFALLATTALAVAGAMLSGGLRIRVSWADAAIVGLVAAVWLSASQGLDRRVAINLAWQWVGVGFAYLLMRNLPRTRGESCVLAGVLAATAAAVSAYALYQVGVELPALREMFRQNPERLLARYGMTLAPGSPEYDTFVNRVLFSTEPFATFGLPNSLAGYVVGPLVVAIGVLLAGMARGSRREEDGSGLAATLSAAAMAVVPVLVVLVVLLLTKSRGAFLGLVIGGLILAAAMVRRLGRRAIIGGTMAAVVVCVAAAAGLWKLGLLDREVLTQSTLSLRYRYEYWVGTWRLLFDGDTWLTGLGPGNFRTAYRRHKLLLASEDVADPHNLFLEVWAVAGIAALVLLVASLGLVLWNLFGPARGASEPTGRTAEPADPPRPCSLLLWGGLGGWLGVLIFGDLNLFADDNESLARWLVLGLGWGLAVALAGPLWSRVELSSAAIGAAVVAMVVNLLAAGGIGYASVASMLWGLAAVGMNLRDDRPAGRARELPGLFPPFVAAALLAAVIGTFYGTVSPYWRAQALMNQADAILADRPNLPRSEDLDRVADLLERAINADDYATRPYLALAELELLAWLSRGSPPEDAVWSRIERILKDARTPPRNPLSLEVRLARIGFANRILASRRDLPSRVRDRLRTYIADASYTIATEIAPASPIEHARAAEALAAIGQFDVAAGEGEVALELDARTPHVDKKLPDAMRDRIEAALPEWRAKASGAEEEDAGRPTSEGDRAAS